MDSTVASKSWRSSPSLLLTSVVAIISYVLLRAIIKYNSSPLRHLPGPWHTKITGLVLKFATLTGRRMFVLHAWQEKYGPIVRVKPEEVFVADNDSFRQIYNTKSGWRKTRWYADFILFPRLGVFAQPDPALHAARRRLMAQAFSKTSMRDTWEPSTRALVRSAVSKIYGEASKGHADILKWWTLLASDVGSLVMFGESFDGLELGEKSESIRQIETAVMSMVISMEFPFLRTLGKYLGFGPLKLFALTDSLLEHGDRAVATLRRTGRRGNIFSKMVEQVDAAADQQLDDLDIKIESINIFIAAVDTTALTTTFLCWTIMKYPAIRERLEAELVTLPEGYKDADLEKLQYLNAVVSEGLRLYGAAPGTLPRSVPENGATLHGYSLPGGVTVAAQAYTMHRKNFQNPEVFDPERFLREQTSEEKAAYFPFGAGSRTCLGIHLAMMELRYAIAMMFDGRSSGHDFRLKLAPTTTDASMALEDYFIISPVSHKCEVTRADQVVS